MIKFTAKSYNGRYILGIGLSFGNLKKFLAEPGDTFIRIEGKEVGLPIDTIIFSGETEGDMEKLIQQFIGPNTVVYK
jgi:hypothetical protein